MDETTEQEQEKKEECLHKHENGKHEGPYHRYMWNVRVSRYRNYPNQGTLCETCAKSLGAWQLPDKART